MDIQGRCIGFIGTKVEPFIRRVEGRDADVDNAELADGPMAAERLDQDRTEGADGDYVAIKLHVALAFENHVDLRVLLVIVDLGVPLDVYDVNRSGSIVRLDKGPPGEAARALHRVDIIEVGHDVIGRRDSPVAPPPSGVIAPSRSTQPRATVPHDSNPPRLCGLKPCHRSGIFCRNVPVVARVDINL